MKVRILEEAYNKIVYWTKKADFEVSGLGLVEIQDGILTVTDAILVKQEGSAAETEMQGEDITKAMYKYRKHKGDIRLWWHSHVNMGVSPSGTDNDTIKQLGTHGWFLSLIVNKSEETYLAYNQGTPFEVEVEKMQLEIMCEANTAWENEMDKEFDKHVTRKVYTPPVNAIVPTWGEYYNKTYPTPTKPKTLDSTVRQTTSGLIVRTLVDGAKTAKEVFVKGHYKFDKSGRYDNYEIGKWEKIAANSTPEEHIAKHYINVKFNEAVAGDEVYIKDLGWVKKEDIAHE